VNAQARRRFRITWKDGTPATYVTVDESALRFYEGETIWEVAAAVACIGPDLHRVHSNVKDVVQV